MPGSPELEDELSSDELEELLLLDDDELLEELLLDEELLLLELLLEDELDDDELLLNDELLEELSSELLESSESESLSSLLQLPTGYSTSLPPESPRIPLPLGQSGPSDELEELLLLEELELELLLELPLLDEDEPDDEELPELLLDELELELLDDELSELLESSLSGGLPEVFISTNLKYP